MHRRHVVALMTGLAVVVGGFAARGEEPSALAPAELNKLDMLIDKLRAKKDVEGLIIALEGIGKIPGPRPRRLEEIKRKVIGTLGALKSPEAIDPLIKEAERGSHSAIRALGEIGDERALDALIRVVRSGPDKRAAIGSAARIGGPKAREVLMEVFCDRKETRDVRLKALQTEGKEHLLSEEADCRKLLRMAADLNDPPATAVLREPPRAGDPHIIGPLIETVSRLSDLIDTVEDKPEKKGDGNPKTRVTKAFLTGLMSLEYLARKFSEHVGYSVILGCDVCVQEKGKERIRYNYTQLAEDREKRNRVTAFWAEWWNANKAKLLECPGGGEPAARAARFKAGRLKLAEAERAFEDVVRRYGGTTAASMSLMHLASVKARLGKFEEACATYVQYRIHDFKAGRRSVPGGAELDRIRAQAIDKTAQACMSRRPRVTALKDAMTLYEKLLKEYPDSPLVPGTKKHLQRLKGEILRESPREPARKAIAAVIKALEKALQNKDADAVIAQLAQPAKADKVRTQLDAFFKGPEYEPVTYSIRTIDFNAELTKATVKAEVIRVRTPEKKGGTESFRFIKTDKGWKLERL